MAIDLGSPTPTPPRRAGGSFRTRLVLLAASGAYLAAQGRAGIEDAFRHPGDGGWFTIVATVLVVGTAISLVLRVGRGAPPVDPLRIDRPAIGNVTGQPVTTPPMARRSVTNAPAMPTATPAGPGDRSPRTPQETIARGRTIFSVLAVVVGIAIGVAKVAHLANDARVEVPQIGKAFQSTCPRPRAGAGQLDTARTDCLPLDVEDVFDTAGATTSIQRTPYTALDRDQSDACGSLAVDAAARAELRRDRCETVLRGLFATADGHALGAATLVVFDSRAHAEAAGRAYASRAVVRSLATPDTERTLPPRLDQLDARTECFATQGRYLMCDTVAPTAGRVAGGEDQLLTMASNLHLLTVDAIVARQFKSL